MLRELSDSELGEEELELFWVATHWIIQDSGFIFPNMGNDSVVDNSRILCNTTQLDFIWLREKKHDLLRKEGNSHAAPTPNGQHPDLCWLKTERLAIFCLSCERLRRDVGLREKRGRRPFAISLSISLGELQPSPLLLRKCSESQWNAGVYICAYF